MTSPTSAPEDADHAGDVGHVTVRTARHDDAQAIEAVVLGAFEPDDRPAALVAAVRSSAMHLEGFELVAELDDNLVGHILLSRSHVVDTGTRHEVLTLAPLSVRQAFQGRGIGTALGREAVARADAALEPLITVEGHPTYYPRFGFRLASDLGLEMHLPGWAPREAAMARRRPGAVSAPRGRVECAPAFVIVLED